MSQPAELPHEQMSDFTESLRQIYELIIERQKTLSVLPTIADQAAIRGILENLPRALPTEGSEYGLKGAIDILLKTILPSLAHGQAGPRYFGFVTGGTLPSALLTDMVVSMMDANVQVHLPNETLSTVVEKIALDMVLDLLHLNKLKWTGTFTTGATASNVLAIACGRQATLKRAYRARKERESGTDRAHSEGTQEWDPAEDGLYGLDVPPIKVFTCQAHASIQKSAALLGIGRKNVVDIGKKLKTPKWDVQETKEVEEREQTEALARAETLEYDIASLECALRECQSNAEGTVVVVGMGEVVTGALTDQTLALRSLCDKYGAWLHMDAAFAAFVCTDERFHWISQHMDVCDSLTCDGHKTLNVPYDCGILLIKKHSAFPQKDGVTTLLESEYHNDHMCYLDDICGFSKSSPLPAYLASTSSLAGDGERMTEIHMTAAGLPSPLHRNLENSRRFRALPLYVSLLSQGHYGIRLMVGRNLQFAARIRQWLRSSPYYQVLTPFTTSPSRSVPKSAGISPRLGARDIKPWEDEFWATSVVLFRPHPETCPVENFREPKEGHLRFINAIKHDRIIYISPGSYCGLGGARLAVGNWYTGVNGDYDYDQTVKALTNVMLRNHVVA